MPKNIVPQKNNNDNKFIVQGNEVQTWDDLIRLAERKILLSRIRQEEIRAALKLYKHYRDSGALFPGIEAVEQSAHQISPLPQILRGQGSLTLSPCWPKFSWPVSPSAATLSAEQLDTTHK